MTYHGLTQKKILSPDRGCSCVLSNLCAPACVLAEEPCTNNAAKHNNLVIGMKIMHESGIRNLQEYDDSMLIVNQVRGEFKVYHKGLVPYHTTSTQMADIFKTLYIQHIPRN